VNPHLVFYLRKIAVKLATKLDQQAIVGKFQMRFGQVFRTVRGGQRADAQWALLLVL
jgi:hypothetical protein